MTAHITKTWFVDGQIIEQVIPESEIYKREWVGLTDAEIWQMVNDCSFNRDLHADKFARAIEAKLKEKNT